MQRSRSRQAPETDYRERLADFVAEAVSYLVGVVALLLAFLFFIDKSGFWSIVNRWVLPALAALALLLAMVAIYVRWRAKRERARLSAILAQIAEHQLTQEVRNFIDGFGNDKDCAEPWVSASGSFTFNRSQITRLADLLRRQGAALSPSTNDDILAVLEHFIDEKEERFLTERVTARVTPRFTELNQTGDDFERLIVRLYEAMGYVAKRIGRTGDQGGDVIASKSGENVLIQAKFYGSSVGNAAVQQAFAAHEHYRCTRAAVVTTSSFTKEAIALAHSTKVELIDGEGLKRLLAEHLKESWS